MILLTILNPDDTIASAHIVTRAEIRQLKASGLRYNFIHL